MQFIVMRYMIRSRKRQRYGTHGVLRQYFERRQVEEWKKLIATASVNNVASCKTLEKAGFSVIETRMYQDLHDECKNMSNIYVHLGH